MPTIPSSLPVAATGGRRRLVVVGNGMVGVRVVEEVLALGGAEDFAVTIFGDEPYGNYNRIQLSNLLAGVEDEDHIFLNPLSWYGENGVTLHAGVRVTRIDRDAKTVESSDGRVTPYDVLVLATGSCSFIPPIQGIRRGDGSLLPGVFGFRNLDDTRAMIAYADSHRRGVVLGGGVLGLEAARGLQDHGLDVTVVEALPHLMAAQLDAEGGRILTKSVERLGIATRLGVQASRVLGDDKVVGLELGDGSVVDTDMVVVCAGVRPHVELARAAGLLVERAIVVDDQMRTADPSVYAAGECAQHRGEVYGLVAPLWEQAGVLARHLTGADPDAAYLGSRISTKLKAAGIAVAAMGLKTPEHEDDEFVRFVEPKSGVYKSVVIRDGRLLGATLLGDVSKVAFLMQAFREPLPLPEERVRLLFDLGGPPAEVQIAELDDDAQVCNCNGVSKGDLVACVRSGICTVGGVMDKTRAGKGCGSCKPLVAQIVEWANGGKVEEDPSAEWYVKSIPLDKAMLMAAIRERELTSVSSVFAALATDGREHAPDKMALASLLHMMWGREYVDERDARFVNDRVHANIQKDGTFSVIPQMKGGVTSPAQLKKIAEVAEKYDIPMVKLTGGQRIDLLGVRKEDLPKVWADLGMPSGYGYGKSFRTVKTCVGAEFCRYGLGDSTALGIDLESRFQGIPSPAKIKLAVAGCPRNCSEALCKDLGVVAVDGGGWEIYVGGAAGAHIRKGDLLAKVHSHEDVLRIATRFLQYYRENARWLERTYSFVPRIGLDEIKAIVVDDRDGVGAQLDAGMQVSIDAYSDPWREADEPVTPGQFRPSLPLVELPLVPVR